MTNDLSPTSLASSSAPPAPPVIRVRGVKKRFGSHAVLQGVDLEVWKGETHVIIGRSGEGKSVLLKHICALLPFDAGRIDVDGRPVDIGRRASVQHVRSRVSMVFQNAALFDSMTVRENVGFYLDERGGRRGEEAGETVRRLLDEVNLSGTERLYPAELSGGMRKRIGLARALASEPDIVLYDEPTTGLDPVTTDMINALIVQTRERRGVTSIVVTHDMQSAYRVGDRISMLYRGRVIFTGTPDETRATENPFVRQFIEGHARGPITDHDDEALASVMRGAAAKPQPPSGDETE